MEMSLSITLLYVFFSELEFSFYGCFDISVIFWNDSALFIVVASATRDLQNFIRVFDAPSFCFFVFFIECRN